METSTLQDGAAQIEPKPAPDTPPPDVAQDAAASGAESAATAGGAAAAVSEELIAAVEVLLMSADRPMPPARIIEVLDAAGGVAAPGGAGSYGKLTVRVIHKAVDALNAQLEASARAFRVESIAGGYRVMTLARYAAIVEAYRGKRERHALSRASVETLAVIAYRQPITRAALEAIRGVSCGEVLRSLTERRLITVAGRAEELGRPLLYATTRQFLETFGLASIKDLPPVEEFGARVRGEGRGGSRSAERAEAETPAE